MSELDILISDRVVALKNNKSITLTTCELDQLKPVLAIVNGYAEHLSDNNDTFALATYILANNGQKAINDLLMILRICSNLRDQTEEKQDEFFNKLHYDELAYILAQFLAMNKDFFLRLITKILKKVIPENKS